MDKAMSTQAAYEVNDLFGFGLFYENPTIAFIVFAIALAFASVLLIYLYQLRARRLDQQYTKELSTFITYVCNANERVCEIDMKKKKISEYHILNGKILKREELFSEYENLQNIFYHEDIPIIKKQCSADIINGIIDTTGETYFECRAKVSSGEYHWCSYFIQGIPKDKKHPRSAMLYKRDIDAKKREDEAKNAQIRDALDMAQRESEAKGIFMSRMSHEIRTPLNAVIGYMTIAQNPNCNREKIQDCIGKSKIAAKHLLGIVNDVLDISAIESGKFKISEDIFDLRQLTDEVSAMFANQTKQKGIQFASNIKLITQGKVIGDELRINQVLMNLLSNAVKFTPEGGRVSLDVTEESVIDGKANICFSISDTGIGMTEKFMSRIFTPFEQQDASISRNYGGTGLGLAISKNLITILGGTITVSSEEGKGTVFTVRMPFGCCSQDYSIDGEDGIDESEEYDFTGKHALMAEDGDMNIEIAVEFLQQVGFTVDVVRNGKDAYKRFTGSPAGTYQVILMDIQMPIMNGYDAAQKIRSSGAAEAKSIPIIAMTADAFDEDIVHITESGMNAFILKPIDVKRMYATLARYV